MRKIHRLVVVSVFLLTLVAPTFAQTESNPIASETYGTSSLTYLTLGAWEFRPIDSATTYGTIGNGIYNAGGGQYFEAPVRLPEGAIVSYLELYGCNTNGALTITNFFRRTKNDGTQTFVNGPTLPANVACTTVSANVSPFTIDNTTTSYTIDLNFVTTSADTTRSIKAYRIGYKLQVSPPPLFATFTDVPTSHVFFQYVEALVAAGITSGCSAGNFCPDAPVTRGQMAVFLSRALGLHWAP